MPLSTIFQLYCIEEKEIEIQTIKFVKVECPAYATVEFNSVTSENLTIFGNGTTINVFPDGYYMLHHYDGGRLEVDTEGTVSLSTAILLTCLRQIVFIYCHHSIITIRFQIKHVTIRIYTFHDNVCIMT
jgi:hypothetical protein